MFKVDSKVFVKICLIFIITRLLILIMGSLNYATFPERGFVYQKTSIKDALNFEKVWDNFDSGWYQTLASEGYPIKKFIDTEQEIWGFMPLYPIVISLFSLLTGLPMFYSGVIVSNLCTLLAIFIFYKLVEEKYGKGLEVVSLFMVSAGSFYLSIVYDTGLYVLLTSLVFYLSFKNKFALAFFFAGLASITRIQGCLLFVIPAVEILINHRSKVAYYIPFILLALMPLALLMLYLEKTCGEPLAFIKIQHAWGSANLFPLQGFIGLIKGIRPGGSFTNALFWVLIVWAIITSYKKIPISYIVFTVLYLLLSTSNAELFGATRYMLGIFPFFIAISIGPNYLKQIFILLNILFLSLTISAFVTNTSTFV